MTDMGGLHETEARDREAIVAAMRRALEGASLVKDPALKVERFAAGYALLSATDPRGAAQKLSGYARRGKDGWEVLGLGTYFAPEFYRTHGIPESLQG